MTKGFLIFAQNNSDVDYCKIASYCARRLKKFIDLPVSIVTDSKDWLLQSQPDAEKLFDKIITSFTDVKQKRRFFDGSMYSKQLQWKNLSRVEAYDLTPYDQTIIIDSDYLVASDNLSKFFDQESDVSLFRNSYDLAQWRDTSSFNYLNDQSIPFYWATVVYFKKGQFAESFFNLLKHIRSNWGYYRLLYNIDSNVFRNDYAFSIAMHIMNGCIDSNVGTLPGKKFYTLDRDILLEADDTKFKFLIEKEKYFGEYIGVKLQDVDVHVMNKYSLSRLIDGTA